MARFDDRLMFGENFDLTESTGTYLFTNQIDLSVVRDIGAGNPLWLVIIITTGVDSSGGTATINFRLRSDDSASIHATTSTAHGETGAIAEASLPQGKQLTLIVPIEGNAFERYLGLQAVIAGEAVTVGTATAYLTPHPPRAWKAYPDADN